MRHRESKFSPAAGFSLLELLIAMAVTLIMMAAASALLAGSFNVRARQNQQTEALADAQRALNIMTREIGNAGFGLTNNGIVTANSDASSIRVRANLNAFSGQTTSNAISDPNEDVRYMLAVEGGHSYIIRLDVNTSEQTTVLANRIDTFRIGYYSARVNYTVPTACGPINTGGVAEVAQRSAARFLVIQVCVELPARGRPGSPGYQPPAVAQLVSDVTLRNANLLHY